MFVKTQFETIVNLAYYSKVYIDYAVNSPISDNIYHEISATLEDNDDDGNIKNIRKKTLALIPADKPHLPNSGELARTAFNDLFKAMLDNSKSAFDISGYYKQPIADNKDYTKNIEEIDKESDNERTYREGLKSIGKVLEGMMTDIDELKAEK